jgi:O-antigen/teichoic acid export membrane protein
MSIVPHDPEEFTGELLPDQILVSTDTRWTQRGQRIVKLITGFLLGQGTSQSLNILAGLFLVRKLSVESYGQFGLAVAFQAFFSILMDLGFASTIIPLVGERRNDRALIGTYIRAAKHLRDRMFWILAPVAAAAFLGIVYKQHWSLSVKLLLIGSVLLSLYSEAKVSYFSAPLFIFGRLQEFYVPQVFSAIFRLLAYVGLAFAGGLNGWTAAGLTALTITVNGSLICKAAHRYIKWPNKDNPEAERELLHYILPASPAIIFAAFQAQISLFLVSIFGGGTLFIAEVTALGRIGQLFVVFSTFNTIVVEPYIARLSRERLRRTYIGIVLLSCIACIPVLLGGFFRPDISVWILGAKYEGLKDVIGLYLLSCCMNFVSATIWIMNRARKWVFWSGSIVEVVLLIGVQIAFLSLVGVKNTREAVLFNLASSFCYMGAHGYVCIYGFLKGPRLAPAE